MTEGPYKLPESWRWVRLGEVCQCERRTVDPRRSPKATFYLYSIPAYDESQRPKRLDGSQIGSSKVVIGPGVCLFSKLNPRIPRAWVVAGVPQDGMPVASTEFMPLRPNPNVLDLDYLGKLLMTEWFVSQVRLDVTGATGSRQRLKPGVILNALVPLPPHDEQRRIVARIEELMSQVREAKRLRQQAKEDAERLWQSVLAETFPRPGSDLPSDWRWVRLGEVIQYIGNGTTAKQNKDGRGAPVTRMETIANEVIDSTRVGYIDNPDETLLKKYRLTPGDILFSHINSDPHLGKTALYEGDPPILIHGMNLLRIVPRTEALSSKYLNFLFRHYRNAGYFLEIAQRAIGQSSINQKKMRNLLIPLPPLAEQRRIVAHLEAVQDKICALKTAQAETDEELKRLEQAILDKAFRGEL